MIGKTVSNYKIRRKIGQGGMGVVYEAEDLKLSRHVALKFLPHHLSADERAKTRFVHEAKAASALDHPNIGTIHEIDETPEGEVFIVMPRYEGSTFEQIIDGPPVELDRAFDIVRQAAVGLSKAHDKGIVHRDIKPGNLFVTHDGIVKILDFGLAKLSGVTKVTQEGATVGTVAYMSPEQTSGGDVDHRTDIWALGVVLYELLAKRLPFRGEFDAAMIYSVLNEEPQDIDTHCPGLPPTVSGLLQRSLAKDPARRYAHFDDFLAELDTCASGSGAGAVPAPTPADDLSVVVVPFDDISPEKDNEYFAEGLTEEIITDLSRIAAMRVISRNSSSMLKGTPKDTKTIGRELGVHYVLRGSVRKAGNDVRINVQLVDAQQDSNVWADKYAGTLDDIFEIQEQVSRSIVDALEVHLSPQEIERVTERNIDDVRAYEFYLRARQNIYLWSNEALDTAVEQLQKGIDIVGDNALLYATLSHAHWQYVNAGFKSPEHLDVAQEYADKVLAIDPESPHGNRLQGLIAIFRARFQDAVDRFKQALAVDPNDPDSLFWLITVYFLAGKTEEAAPYVEHLLEIDPLNPVSSSAPGWVHFFQGRFDQAIGPIKAVYDSDPTNPGYRYIYIQMLVYNSRYDEAHELIDRLVADTPDHPFALMCGLLKHALNGNDKKALEAMTPEFRSVVQSDAMHSWFIATCYALLGERKEAIDWLENAVNMGFISHPFFSRHDRLLDELRGDERFERLMDRVEREWERFVP